MIRRESFSLEVMKPVYNQQLSILSQLERIQGLQNQLSTALEANCYDQDQFLTRLSFELEHQLVLLRERLVSP